MATTVGIVGAEELGVDLAHLCASNVQREGGRVLLFSASESEATRARARLEEHIEGMQAKKRLSDAAIDAHRRAVTIVSEHAQLAPASLIFDTSSATVEDLRYVDSLQRVEAVVDPETPIAFFSRGLTQRELGRHAAHPERCFVVRLRPPVMKSPAAEVIVGANPEANQRFLHQFDALGKVAVLVADGPCSVADELRAVYVAEAARVVEEGLASADAVDGIAHDLFGDGGPLRLLRDGPTTEQIRNDLDRLHKLHGSAWFIAPSHLDPRAANTGTAPERLSTAIAGRVASRLQAALLGRALALIDRRVCNASDVDWLSRSALGMPEGLIALAQRIGAAGLLGRCWAYAERHQGFDVAAALRRGKLPIVFRDLTLRRDDDGIAVVTVRRPEVLNALRGGTVEELKTCLAELDADPDVIGVVLTGSRGALAGADIKELATLATPAETAHRARLGQALTLQIERMSKPVVAALNGPVLGGGSELSMGCWARTVGPRLMAGQPEVHLGLIPGYGGTQRLPRLVPFQQAWEMLRTGEPMGAQRAVESGWASGPVTEDPVAYARELIHRHRNGTERLAPLNPAPVEVPNELAEVEIGHHSRAIDAILVDVVREGLRSPLTEGLEIEAQGFGRCHTTADMAIGLRNFVENGPRVRAEFLHR
ncbi:MAG: enoyl-CoA hydratase/isomerase family protein [Myxococcales bacterium]|nr:enoyl-CoA hydratase/isomerase family protein [Myxococcales bacterium]